MPQPNGAIVRAGRYVREAAAGAAVASADRPATEVVDGAGKVWIYGAIDPFFGVDSAEVARDIAMMDVGRIDVHIDSPGGRVFDGFSIMSALAASQAEVHVHIDGLAASMASLLAMAGDRVSMADGGQIMIHNPLTVAYGNAADMRDTADLLDQIGADMARLYARRTSDRGGMSLEDVVAAMEAEVWYGAIAAKEAGLVDEVVDVVPSGHAIENMACRSILAAYRHLPEQVAAAMAPKSRKDIRSIREFEAFLRDEGGFSRSQAKRIAACGFGGTGHRDGADWTGIAAGLRSLNETLSNGSRT